MQPSASRAFEQLDERIRRWVWQQGWQAFRPAQEEAIPVILGADRDVLVCAPTSAGKTEAAFLPILTRILADPRPSIRVLYISPLKALINDQFSRLELLCEDLDIAVTRWHGDVSSSVKGALFKRPRGVLLITPESLEAVLMQRGRQVSQAFAHLEYVVVDELHAFVGSERGAQLQSLLCRLDALAERSARRIGLSATLAEPQLAAHFLRPTAPTPGTPEVAIIEDDARGEIKAQLKAFYTLGETNEDAREVSVETAIVDYLLKTMRGSQNLLFCNSRSDVEGFADALSVTSKQRGLSEEFFAHHGNLAKELREFVEQRLQQNEMPTTVVCTSTLEMGIDIGAMRSVGQIDPPPSVAALRQRVGRSGRRGEPSILRMIAREERPTAKSDLATRLHVDLVQSICAVELMAEGWLEPPEPNLLHLSTCVQQVMSLVVERGGASVPFLYTALVEKGAFASVGKARFVELLKAMTAKELITQMSEGTILLAGKGERLAEHYSFYAAFATPEEYHVIGDGKPLGTLPLEAPYRPGDNLLFAGKRWTILSLDDERRVVVLKRSRGGKRPTFHGEGFTVHSTLRGRMRKFYEREDMPAFLDPTARAMVESARATYQEYELGQRQIVSASGETWLLPWAGDRQTGTLRILLTDHGLKVEPDSVIVTVAADENSVIRALEAILSFPTPTGEEMAKGVGNKRSEKYDWVLSEPLLNTEFAARKLDGLGAVRLAAELLRGYRPR